jgi:hypothetical protein
MNCDNCGHDRELHFGFGTPGDTICFGSPVPYCLCNAAPGMMLEAVDEEGNFYADAA